MDKKGWRQVDGRLYRAESKGNEFDGDNRQSGKNAEQDYRQQSIRTQVLEHVVICPTAQRQSYRRSFE